jgi:SOS response regulatory protein OraA/RecX
MLRAELRRKGVPSAAIDSALAEVDEPQAAWAAARRVAQRWTQLDPSARRQKLYSYLQRRGFDHDTIRLVLHRLQAAADGDSEETP